MREATARGPSIDISEFERRLRGGEPQGNQPGQANPPGKGEGKSDPLAELARLLHGDEAAAAADPYGKVFADRQRREPTIGQRDRDIFDAAELRGALSPSPSVAPPPMSQSQPQSNDYYAAHASGETQWEHHEPQDYLDYGVEDEPYDEPPARRGLFGALRDRLRPWHAVVALAGVGALSVGLALGHRGGVVAPKELATIKAPEGPAKVQPSSVAEAAAPQRGAAVLDRNQNAPVKKVVSKQEQPVDPAAAVRVVKLGGEGPVDAPHEPAPVGGPNNPYGAEPRRVKTVSVRPDGTVIDNDAPTPAIARPATNVAPPARPPSLAARPSAVEAPIEPPTATPKSPAKPATTPKVAQPPRPKPAAPAAPLEQTAAIEPAQTEAATGGNGGFAVQFGAAGSEDEARRLIQTVNSKFSAQLGGKRLGFRLAKVGEKSVYRVRAAGMSREAAVGVCEKVKASGGSCFVAAN
ncbi:SPOR domain-containing protein [Methylosinus sporium]|uniref:SPOR domain-containing protein n=1 Tax=Methylosinus sporium TaxID=428 RepID=A0A549T1J7_METSR|nr:MULTISPECIES: SPOR domain-containing protein [Methylosinus]MBU3887224.1 SPOR domain-containing protein [Methylosinus sp. KRF6]TRL35711.1 SPOR domain-containing protein [Methylosinus sporium]